jgi:hypothetical protein
MMMCWCSLHRFEHMIIGPGRNWQLIKPPAVETWEHTYGSHHMPWQTLNFGQLSNWQPQILNPTFIIYYSAPMLPPFRLDLLNLPVGNTKCNYFCTWVFILYIRKDPVTFNNWSYSFEFALLLVHLFSTRTWSLREIKGKIVIDNLNFN